MKYGNRALILLAVIAGIPLAVAQRPQPVVGADASAIATAKTDARVSQRPPRATSSEVDVRFCLDFATNAEVVVCADKYRPRGSKAAG